MQKYCKQVCLREIRRWWRNAYASANRLFLIKSWDRGRATLSSDLCSYLPLTITPSGTEGEIASYLQIEWNYRLVITWRVTISNMKGRYEAAHRRRHHTTTKNHRTFPPHRRHHSTFTRTGNIDISAPSPGLEMSLFLSTTDHFVNILMSTKTAQQTKKIWLILKILFTSDFRCMEAGYVLSYYHYRSLCSEKSMENITHNSSEKTIEQLWWSCICHSSRNSFQLHVHNAVAFLSGSRDLVIRPTRITKSSLKDWPLTFLEIHFRREQ